MSQVSNKMKVVVKLPRDNCPKRKYSSNTKAGSAQSHSPKPRSATSTALSPTPDVRASSPVHRSIMTEGLHGDHKECCHLKVSRRPAFKGESGDTKLPMCHYLMDQTFENFLVKLDDVFLSFKRDVSDMDLSIDIDSYKDIYEKLRAEILIAMDKLEFLAIPKETLEQQTEFLKKMKGLKKKLSELRWQYHNAIKDLGFNTY